VLRLRAHWGCSKAGVVDFTYDDRQLGTMTSDAALDRIRSRALDTIIAGLREAFDVQRCTLRLDVPGDVFPVAHEALGNSTRSLIGEQRVDQRRQPVVEALLGGVDQVVHVDTRQASDDPAFLRMLEIYGGMRAQIVTAVRGDGGRLLGIVSLHELRSPRDWTPGELALARAGADMVACLLSVSGSLDQSTEVEQ
jgi:GAF domain-containing protein